MTAKAKTQYINTLKVKDLVEDTFVVKYLAVMQARDGKNYLNVVLADNSGEIEARKWHGAIEASEKIERGSFVFVKGKINQFQNRMQLIISDIGPVEESEILTEEYFKKAESSPDKMFGELVEIVDELTDVYIKDLLNTILHEPEIKRRLLTWPAGRSIHHAYQSGLLEHILSCSQLAVSLSTRYKVNHNFVVAGAILHDLCKVYELSEGQLVDYTDEGKLIGHLTKGPELIEQYSFRIKSFPYQTKLHLKHILLAHHGHLEFGSPVLPQTAEAYLVHLIDMMDSKMNAIQTIKEKDLGPGSWSSPVKHFGGSPIYKADLPHYSEYKEIPKEDFGQKEIHKKARKEVKSSRYKDDSPLKNSMANMLKDFKIQND